MVQLSPSVRGQCVNLVGGERDMPSRVQAYDVGEGMRKNTLNFLVSVNDGPLLRLEKKMPTYLSDDNNDKK